MKDVRDEFDQDLTLQIRRSPISSTMVHSYSKGEEQHLPSLCSYFSFRTIFFLLSVIHSPQCFLFLISDIKVISLLTVCFWLTGQHNFDGHRQLRYR